jgi:hypothetical protein
MTSLVLRRDLSLEVPKLLIGAVQPYQTLAGPALATSFLYQPELLPFQSTPFSHAAVAPLYFHTLLHTLAEFAETPRAVQHSHVKMQHAPKADFWDAVGTLNCFYYSAQDQQYPKTTQPRGRKEEEGVLHHPAMGAVELVRPSHRRESDVKLTLFNQHHQPIASMLMTGPRDESCGAARGLTREEEHDSLSSSPSPSPAKQQQWQQGERRTPLPYEAPPAAPSGYAASLLGGAAHGPSAVVVGGTQVYGGLYGTVVKIGEGYAHRACYWTDDLATSPTQPTATEKEKEEGEGGEAAPPGATPASAHTVMPPWVLYNCVQEFFFALHRGGVFGSDAAIKSANGWRLASHHIVQQGDAVLGSPLDVVCAAPRVDPHYRLPPWRSQLGLPLISGVTDVPCVSLRCEVRQDGRVISTGVYFFCRGM